MGSRAPKRRLCYNSHRHAGSLLLNLLQTTSFIFIYLVPSVIWCYLRQPRAWHVLSASPPPRLRCSHQIWPAGWVREGEEASVRPCGLGWVAAAPWCVESAKADAVTKSGWRRARSLTSSAPMFVRFACFAYASRSVATTSIAGGGYKMSRRKNERPRAARDREHVAASGLHLSAPL